MAIKDRKNEAVIKAIGMRFKQFRESKLAEIKVIAAKEIDRFFDKK